MTLVGIYIYFGMSCSKCKTHTGNQSHRIFCHRVLYISTIQELTHPFLVWWSGKWYSVWYTRRLSVCRITLCPHQLCFWDTTSQLLLYHLYQLGRSLANGIALFCFCSSGQPKKWIFYITLHTQIKKNLKLKILRWHIQLTFTNLSYIINRHPHTKSHCAYQNPHGAVGLSECFQCIFLKSWTYICSIHWNKSVFRFI